MGLPSGLRRSIPYRSTSGPVQTYRVWCRMTRCCVSAWVSHRAHVTIDWSIFCLGSSTPGRTAPESGNSVISLSQLEGTFFISAIVQYGSSV
jgi:hypothetical protein